MIDREAHSQINGLCLAEQLRAEEAMSQPKEFKCNSEQERIARLDGGEAILASSEPNYEFDELETDKLVKAIKTSDKCRAATDILPPLQRHDIKAGDKLLYNGNKVTVCETYHDPYLVRGYARINDTVRREMRAVPIEDLKVAIPDEVMSIINVILKGEDKRYLRTRRRMILFIVRHGMLSTFLRELDLKEIEVHTSQKLILKAVSDASKASDS